MELQRLDDFQSWSIRCGGERLVVDPWLVDDVEIGSRGRWFRRVHGRPVALRPRQIDHWQIVVLTSALPTHAHLPTLRALDRSVRILGTPGAVRLARSLGFRSTIVLAPGQRIVLEERVALTGIRPAFPYGAGSIGLLVESLDDGVRVYLEPHRAPPRHPVLEPAVDVLVIPVEKLSIAGLALSSDVEESLDLARRLRARWVLATGSAPATGSGLLPERLFRAEGDISTFEALARLHLGEGRGRHLAPGEVFRVPPRRRRDRAAA